MSEVNTVILSTGAYAAIKNENCKYKLFIDNLLSNAVLSADHSKLVFDSDAVCAAMQFVYAEEYKKRLATTRTQAKRYGTSEPAPGVSE